MRQDTRQTPRELARAISQSCLLSLIVVGNAAAGQTPQVVKPLGTNDVFALLNGDVTAKRIVDLAIERGTDIVMNSDMEQRILTLCVQHGSPRSSCQELADALKRESVANAPAIADQALELAKKGDLDPAIAAFRRALRLKPDDVGARYNLATALKQKGDRTAAIDEYRAVLRAQPATAGAHYNLGVLIGDGGDWAGAVGEFQEAARLAPDDASAHAALCFSLWNRREWDSATAACRDAIRVNPRHGLAHHTLGVLFEHQGDYQNALAEYRLAAEADPNDSRLTLSHQRLLKRSEKGTFSYRVGYYRGSNIEIAAGVLTVFGDAVHFKGDDGRITLDVRLIDVREVVNLGLSLSGQDQGRPVNRELRVLAFRMVDAPEVQGHHFMPLADNGEFDFDGSAKAVQELIDAINADPAPSQAASRRAR